MTRSFASASMAQAGVAALAMAMLSSGAWAADTTLTGVFALPNGTEKVGGRMTVRETGPLRVALELTFTNKANGEQIGTFEEELTQQLHILAVDDDLSTLVHEHVKQADADGRFVAELTLPEEGLYHIYADAVPSGYGQQVLRFDVSVGESESEAAGGAEHAHVTQAASAALESSDDGYSVLLDASQLKAGEESLMTLSIEKDGEPATALTPYLGVPAHAVFVRADDLAYVHAHATPAAQTAPAETALHGHATQDGQAPADAHGGHGAPSDPGSATAQEGHGDDVAAASAHMDVMGEDEHVPAELALHVTPPAPGTYGLWIEFMGEDEVRTVPFTINVP